MQSFVDLFIDGYFAAQGCAFVQYDAHTFASTRQREPLGLNRGASSYQAVTEAPLPLPLMPRMNEPRLRTPCSG